MTSVGVKMPFKQIVTLSQMVQFLLFIAQVKRLLGKLCKAEILG